MDFRKTSVIALAADVNFGHYSARQLT